MRTHETSPRSLQFLTIAATSASGIALVSATSSHSPDPTFVVSIWALVWMLMILAAFLSERWSCRTLRVPAVTPLFAALATLPSLCEIGLRIADGSGSPLEIVLMNTVQLIACGMASTSGWIRFQPLTMIAAMFTTLFSASIGQDAVTRTATIFFALFGLGWLIATYWFKLNPRMANAQVASQPRWSILFLLLVAVVLACGVAAIRSEQTWALAGFVPSSGGDGLQDSAANRGVGDGEGLVAGQDQIQSFGPIEDAPFRASEDPSLYDLFNDTYEEPVKVKEQQRAISIQSDAQNQMESRMAKSDRAGKEFSIVRKQRNRAATEMRHLESDALLYVKGRTPLHLRHELFNSFDGTTWSTVESEVTPSHPELTLATIANRPWICWTERLPLFEMFGPIENHALKIIHLKSDRIPSPLNLEGVHIDLVDRLDFFRIDGDQLLAVETTTLPELSSVHLRSRTIEQRQLTQTGYWIRPEMRNETALPNETTKERLLTLATKWTQNRPFGLSQVEAIVAHLRTEYELDPAARPPMDCEEPTLNFLFESRRGPDYQFATAAALLLRSLGYPTRLVGGFYASPARYDRFKGHTAVVGADAHVWVEVAHASNHWVTVEPTPGYEVLGPPLNWWQRATQSAWQACSVLAAHWGLLVCGTIMLAAVYKWRAVWLDWCVIAWWSCFRARQARQRILQTAYVLDLRLWLIRQPRRPGETWASTVQRLSGHGADEDGLTNAFVRLVEWANFAPDTEPIPCEAVGHYWDICQRVVKVGKPVVRPRRPFHQSQCLNRMSCRHNQRASTVR